jgi:cytochrome c oxidase subunit 2
VVYISPLRELSVGNLRLLDVENRLVIPAGVLTQFNITRSDVIHSFALPSLGAKVDATSGLLTVVPVLARKVGAHYGQCSEICGINHRFIPLCIEVVPLTHFLY